MRRIYLSMAVGAGLIAGLLIAGLVLSMAPAQEPRVRGGDAPPAWEYRAIVLTDVVKADQALNDPAAAVATVEARFNELGKDGWDLAISLPGAVVFKRPKRRSVEPPVEVDVAPRVEKKSIRAKPDVRAEPNFTASPSELVAEARRNLVAFEAKYNGQTIKVSGILEEITKNGFVIREGRNVQRVWCEFGPENLGEVAGLTKGSQVTVIGVYSRYLNPMAVILKDCWLPDP
jgi:tRNA_anti-like